MTKQTNHKPGATAAASATAPNAYTRITYRIVADLEQGVRPWCKPWGGDQLGARITRPRRANGKPYSGINTLILWLEAVEKGHPSPTWMTYRQAQQLGGQVRRGERGSQVVYMGETTKTRRDEGTGEETEQGVRFLTRNMGSLWTVSALALMGGGFGFSFDQCRMRPHVSRSSER